MTYIEKNGDLFESTAEALGHGVNCKGLMGKGIARAFREKFPVMYEEYRLMCREGLLEPGQIYPFRDHFLHKTVINIASQEFPGPDAKLEWLVKGLEHALIYCEERGLSTFAIPQIGCGIGGLDWTDVGPALEWTAEKHPGVDLEVWSL